MDRDPPPSTYQVALSPRIWHYSLRRCSLFYKLAPSRRLRLTVGRQLSVSNSNPLSKAWLWSIQVGQGK